MPYAAEPDVAGRSLTVNHGVGPWPSVSAGLGRNSIEWTGAYLTASSAFSTSAPF